MNAINHESLAATPKTCASWSPSHAFGVAAKRKSDQFNRIRYIDAITGGPIVCFSAEASFTVGAALIPAGIYCVWSAFLKKPSYLGLAAVPLFFGIQQIGEGFVWQGLHHDDPAQIRAASLVFLFFALAFWPFWFPFLTTLMEPKPKRKWIFAVLSVAATVWFWVLFYPLVVGPESLLTTLSEPGRHSIQYLYPDLAIYQYVPRTPLRVLYFLSVALPPILGSENWGRIPGLVLGASALIAVLLFDYAFVSVWCFFAAVLAVYCCFLFYRLPMPGSVPVESAPGRIMSHDEILG
jgi:hypothetical protein